MMKKAIFLCAVFVVGVVLAGENGCSLSLDGNTRLVLDKFQTGSPVGVFLPEGTFEAWIQPTQYEVEPGFPSPQEHQPPGVIFQTGRISYGYHTPYSRVLSYDLQSTTLRVDIYSSTYVNEEKEWKVKSYHSTTKVVPNLWTHVAMHVKEDSSFKVFINGASVAMVEEAPTTDRSSLPPHRFSIGSQFLGYIDEVKLWSKLLESSELSYTMSNKPCSVGDLVLYLPFDECAGNITADVSSSAACGKMRSASWGGYNDKMNGRDFREGDGHWRHGMTENRLHPVPFYIDNTVIAVKRGNDEGRGYYKEHHHSHEEGTKHEHGHEHRHGHGGRKCGGLSSITFGPSSPAVPECTIAFSVDMAVQCPYSTFVHGGGGDSSSSESDSDNEFDSSDDDSAIGVFWIFAVVLVTLSCLCCCRKLRQRTCTHNNINNTYHAVPVEEEETQAQQEYSDYPGIHPFVVAPQFAVHVADPNTPLDAQQQHQQPIMMMAYPPDMAMMNYYNNNNNDNNGAAMVPPYVYYMPSQAVYYAPNMERASGENQQH